MLGSRRRAWLLAGAGCGIALGIAVGLKSADYQKGPKAAASRGWHGKVVTIARAGAEKTGGLTMRGAVLVDGAEVSPGDVLVTDARTRARVAFDDGTTVLLDRDTELSVEADPRSLRMPHGALVADVAHVEGAPNARLLTPNATVNVLGTKLALTSGESRTSVEVVRGTVRFASASSPDAVDVNAGQEGVASASLPIEVTPANDLAQRVAFGERLGEHAAPGHNEDTDAPVSGLGELRARRPGKTDEKDHAVHLASHAAKIRIVGNQARTEIDEVFSNDTGDDLEGVYRFPLPPSAEIERLALEVDGKLVEGAFVDKAKGAAIWRGAIQNATPKPIATREEIFWVPGRWHDPALLEWQRGGRFELKIFPIPKHGSRRIVLAYTETVAPVAGLRRYVYPLPQSTASTLRIDSFAVDVQVLGADAKVPVQAKGYELSRADGDGTTAKLSQTMTGFTPSGDLAIEYTLAGDRTSDVTAWAYDAASLTGAAPPAADADAYVAIALRPKLPRWADVRPRDQVVVVDAGRAMFGERFARARRLAEQITEEMDRRDRLTVLVCDVSCRAMPGGWKAPGPGAAHDVDAFLAGVTPDGASDLVGAVRRAAGEGGRDAGRDLRVVLLSDGNASAGYRRPERLAGEVTSALAPSNGTSLDARSLVVTVPIGSDADVASLAEIARGGGGVVVPYAPGEALETAALDVLNATYGTTLRDVELTLPDGLHDTAPALLGPMRAGSETVVTARMTGGHVHGDIILKGKVGGDPFEARYPIDLASTSAAGNAFVPRLYAAARIADEERAGDASRADAVKLSQRFSVPSRFTSLLVLESEAMFRAFGIDHDARGPAWTGESDSVGTEVVSAKDAAPAGGKGDLEASPYGDSVGGSLGLSGVGEGGGGSGAGFGSGHGRMAPARPMPTASDEMMAGMLRAPASPPAPPPAKAAQAAAPDAASIGTLGRGRGVLDDLAWNQPQRGQWMKREWFRTADVGAPSAATSIPSEKLAAARAAAQASPDERSKTRDLVRILAASGLLDEASDVVTKWSERDPLDADAITARADLLARGGDRDAALRVLGGITASTKPASASDAAQVESVLALAHERAGKPEACAFRVAAAELRPEDNDAVARAVACERAFGRATSADLWMSALKTSQRTVVATLAAKYEPAARGASTAPEGSSSGDVVVDASWDGSADLDIAIIDPQGNRAAWSGRMKAVRVQDPTSRTHEQLAFSTSAAGQFTVELVRTDGVAPAGLVRGQVTVRSLGSSSSFPFVLTGARAPVARVTVAWDSRLVAAEAPNPFDRSAAASAMARVQVASCERLGGQTGPGHVTIRFSPSGEVTSALVDAPYRGTDVGSCVARLFQQTVRVPPFDGGSVTVGKSFFIRSAD